MNRTERERKKQIVLIKRIIAGLIAVSVLAIIILTAFLLKPESQSKADEESAASEILRKDNRDEAKLVYGGDTETFDKLNYIVNTFISDIRKGDFNSAYDRWDVDLLTAYGYSYSKEDFVSYYEAFTAKYHIKNGDEKHINFSYEPLTYQDFGAYYLFTFNAAYTYRNTEGKIVTTGNNEYIYTIEKYDFNGSTVYRLLDFNIQDISLYAARFNGEKESGVMISPGIYLNDKENGNDTGKGENTRNKDMYNPYGAKD